MKKKPLMAIGSVILAVALLAVVSAFTDNKEKPAVLVSPPVSPQTDHYFEYTGTGYSETDYETPGNWQYRGTADPGDLCTGFNNNPCIVKTSTSINPNNAVANFVSFLSLASPGGYSGAENYCESTPNLVNQKP